MLKPLFAFFVLFISSPGLKFNHDSDPILLLFQTPEDTALSVTNIIRHQESEYFSSLEVGTFVLFTQSYQM
jgi:hypothetical protein